MRDWYHAISEADWYLFPLYLVFVFIIAVLIKIKNKPRFPYYKYFVPGIMAKVISGIILCLIYEYYYKGAGDTILYYHGSSALKDFFLKDYVNCLRFLFSPLSEENIINFFSYNDEKPVFLGDPHSFFVVRLLLPINLLGLNSFISMTIIMAAISFSGIWKLYIVFISEFPKLEKEMAIAILFVPSVVFWGSGLLKDSITISAVGWFIYGLYFGILKGKKIIQNIVNVLVSSFLIICIKPYILFALIPGSTIWIFGTLSKNINNYILRTGFGILFIALSIFSSYFILLQLGDNLGAYSIDNVFTKAVVTQQDMKKDYYEGNSFDIGIFDGSFSSLIKILPLAINAALFRPYIWEIKNLVMLLSGIENLIILSLTLFLLIKLKFIGFFLYIRNNRLLLFSILFSLFFAFSVGLSISNFGALVRLKIPCIPCYVASIFIIRDYYQKNKLFISNRKY